MDVVCRSDAYYAKMAGRIAGMIRDMIGNAVDARRFQTPRLRRGLQKMRRFLWP